jgi:hypothetical protein
MQAPEVTQLHVCVAKLTLGPGGGMVEAQECPNPERIKEAQWTRHRKGRLQAVPTVASAGGWTPEIQC